MEESRVMQAATVDVLVKKGKFEPPVAVAIAEAIDMTISSSQLVTVPVLDARLHVLKAEMNARFDGVNARFEAFEAKMDAKFQRMRTGLLFWIIGATMTSPFLPKLASMIAKAALGVH